MGIHSRFRKGRHVGSARLGFSWTFGPATYPNGSKIGPHTLVFSLHFSLYQYTDPTHVRYLCIMIYLVQQVMVESLHLHKVEGRNGKAKQQTRAQPQTEATTSGSREHKP